MSVFRGAHRHPFLLLGILLVTGLTIGERPVWAGSRVGIGISIGSGNTRSSLGNLFSGPISDARDLETIVRRIGKDRERFLEASEKQGDLDRVPPVESFPGWARCQEIALNSRPEMLLVRMNMQGIRAAIDLLKGNRDQDYDDSIGRDFPPGFDARDWGEEILARCGASAGNRNHLKRALSHAAAAMRSLFSDVRDGINRDVVFAHHSWERSGRSPAQGMTGTASGAAGVSGYAAVIARRRAAWKLWHTLGCPK